MTPNTQDQEWRCEKCATLLGVLRGDRVHVKHKRAQFVVRGQVMAVCPRCSDLCELDTAARPEAATPPNAA
jgi:hypothetical protein